MVKKKDTEKKERKRRKAVLKDKVILIRATDAQKALLMEVAEGAALGLSSWVLSVAIREAQRVKSKAKES